MHPPLSGGGGGLKLQPNFQKKGIDRTSTFRGGGIFSGGVAIFTEKINENLKYLMIKKVKSKNIFLCHS